MELACFQWNDVGCIATSGSTGPGTNTDTDEDRPHTQRASWHGCLSCAPWSSIRTASVRKGIEESGACIIILKWMRFTPMGLCIQTFWGEEHLGSLALQSRIEIFGQRLYGNSFGFPFTPGSPWKHLSKVGLCVQYLAVAILLLALLTLPDGRFIGSGQECVLLSPKGVWIGRGAAWRVQWLSLDSVEFHSLTFLSCTAVTSFYLQGKGI